MSRNDLKKFVYLTVLVTVATLTLLVWWLDGMQLGPKTLERVPTAVSANVFFWLFFMKWGWKWWPLNYLFKRPYLGGTWVGYLESDWQRGVNNPAGSIPISFSIQQTLFTLVIRSFTNDREGISDIAQVVVKEEIGVTYLSYVYSLREEFRAGLYQQGAAELHVIGGGKSQLRGEYWTNTNTRGRLILGKCCNKPLHSFGEVRERWPIEDWPRFEAPQQK
jgi:hypothetical protein